jgi:hypothetical protein
MPHRVGHQLLKLINIPRQALVWALINRDLIRHHKAVAHPANGSWASSLKA